jgi:outer membrane lipopolysaccharide assembly protein LptE/RlpB
MGNKDQVLAHWIVWVGLVTGLLLAGCGYTIHRQGELPFSEIQIGRIENSTLEPKLQDKLHKALAEEFMKNGIMVSPLSDTKISAVIHTFDMVVLSEKQEITIEYRIFIKADFTLEDKGGKKEFRNIDSPFFVSFASSEDLSTLLAKRELAEEKAMKDVAMRIVGALIYQ